MPRGNGRAELIEQEFQESVDTFALFEHNLDPVDKEWLAKTRVRESLQYLCGIPSDTVLPLCRESMEGPCDLNSRWFHEVWNLLDPASRTLSSRIVLNIEM